MINLFKKKIEINDDKNDKKNVEEAYIILMLEIARLDGKIDDSELIRLKRTINKFMVMISSLKILIGYPPKLKMKARCTPL